MISLNYIPLMVGTNKNNIIKNETVILVISSEKNNDKNNDKVIPTNIKIAYHPNEDIKARYIKILFGMKILAKKIKEIIKVNNK